MSNPYYNPKFHFMNNNFNRFNLNINRNYHNNQNNENKNKEEIIDLIELNDSDEENEEGNDNNPNNNVNYNKNNNPNKNLIENDINYNDNNNYINNNINFNNYINYNNINYNIINHNNINFNNIYNNNINNQINERESNKSNIIFKNRTDNNLYNENDNSNKINNGTNNNQNISKDEPYIIGNIELLDDDDSENSLLESKGSIKININDTNNFIFPINKNNTLNKFNNSFSPLNPIKNNSIYNNNKNYNHTNHNIYSLNNSIDIPINNINNSNDNISNNDKKEEITMTFEESLNRLKNNFNKFFKNKERRIENENIFENSSFRQDMQNNKNMRYIFQYHDIIKELYEKKIETKIVVKNCSINKIIDIFITKMKKLTKKRNIVIKDYKNYLFVIGVEMMIDLQKKEAKEFIIKKMTETYKGNYKINTNDDKCYIIENNNKEKTKLIYDNITNVYMSLSMLLQKIYRDAVFK